MPATPTIPPGFELETPAAKAAGPAIPAGFELESASGLSPDEAERELARVTSPSSQQPAAPAMAPFLRLGRAPRSVAEGLVSEQRERSAGAPLQIGPNGIQPVPDQAALARPGVPDAVPHEPEPVGTFAHPLPGLMLGQPMTPGEEAEFNRPANPQERQRAQKVVDEILNHPVAAAAEAAYPGAGKLVRGSERAVTGENGRLSGALQAAEGAMDMTAPVIGPALLENPAAVARGMAIGMGAGEAAAKAAKKAGASPEEQEAARTVAFFLPTVAASALGVTGSGVETPEGASRIVEALGERTPEGQPIPGTGKVAVGVTKTPEEYGATVKVGKTGIKVKIPRKGAAPPPAGLEAPTIEGEVPQAAPSEAVAPSEQPQATAPGSTPPVPAIRKGGKRAKTPQEAPPATLPPETPPGQPAASQAGSRPQEQAPEALTQEPWQMTQEDWFKHKWVQIPKKAQQSILAGEKGFADVATIRQQADAEHQREVRRAVEAGLQVPSAVLDDYPELKSDSESLAPAPAVPEGFEPEPPESGEGLRALPVDQAPAQKLDGALRYALQHSTSGATERWEQRRQQGLTDEQLKAAIGEEFGTVGGHMGPEGHLSYKGGNEPAFYYGSVGTSGKPTLKGRALVDRVRQVMQIPQPQTAPPAAAAATPAKRIDYEAGKKLYPQQKAALSRALKVQDPDARRAAVLAAATKAVNEWEDKFGAWPDDWSRWQRAVDDAYVSFGEPPRLEDLIGQSAPAPRPSTPPVPVIKAAGKPKAEPEATPSHAFDLSNRDTKSLEDERDRLRNESNEHLNAIDRHRYGQQQLTPEQLKRHQDNLLYADQKRAAIEKELAQRQTLSRNPPASERTKPSAVPVISAAAKNTPEAGAVSLANAVYEKLKAGESLGNVTEFNKLAEQHFGSSRTSGKWTPKDAFDAMEAGVNKYLLDRGKDLMEMPAEKGLAELRQLMSRITSQGTRTEDQIKNQQFSTPPTEAYIAARVADIRPDDTVLEPSAGNGGLAVFAKAAGATVHVNEIAPRRQKMLETVGFGKPTAVDGELINSLLPQHVKPTVVLMNPPFSASTLKSHVAKNRNKYGFNHVEQALQRLEPGGRLVAILGGGQANEPEGGASLTGGQSGAFFDRMASRYNVRANVRVHGKEYQKYGTAFATRIIVIDKGGASSYALYGPEWRSHVVTGNFDTLEEAYNALRDVAGSRPDVAARSPESGVRPAAGSAPSARPGQPGAGVGAVSSPGGGSVRGPHPAGDETAGAITAGPQQPQRPGTSGPPEASAGTQPPPVREQSRPAEPPQAAPAGRPEGVPESADNQRQLAGNEAPGSTLDLSSRDQKFAPEENDSEGFVTYRPTLKGPSHPGSIVETTTMATVPMPPITYKPALPESVVKEGKLSAVQLEPIALAGQQNDIILPGGMRASMLIGDGTGVGKGRISAGILWDNWRQGRKRLVWVSEKWDLMQDALRDLKGIGAEDLAKTVKRFDKWKSTETVEHHGLLFTSYALIRSVDKNGHARVHQLEQWLKGDDGGEGAYILFDESHNLKNAVVANGQQASQVGKAVKGLMAAIPKLRSVSLSATAASDVMNLGYLDRLGLWGPGTPFPNGFQEFANQIGSGGISAMEMVARELKAQGKYVSRTLSFKGVTYREVEHALTPEQKEIYRTGARAWRMVAQRAEGTIKDTTNGGPRARAAFLSLFRAAQQRFFNVLLTTLKIPTAVQEANDALAHDQSVVITLVNTNEAAQNREKNRVAETQSELDEPPDYDFGPAEMLVDLVREHYPVQQYMDDVDENGRPIKVPVYTTDAQGRKTPVTNPEAVRERDALIKEIKQSLKLPANPLDMLIEALGGPKRVAELTGRKERFDPAEGKFIPRGAEGTKRDEVNLSEMRAFQSGKKRIAILSSAAGTGISLHAGNDVPNKQKRRHIILQLGWSADKQLQSMGRTHRTNEAHPPEYVPITSDLGGERRFSSSLARRLSNVGALVRGQAKSASGADVMSKFNFETEQGRQAANTFYVRLLQNAAVPGTDLRGMQVLEDMGVLKEDTRTGQVTVPREDRTEVTLLLNRVLSLDPDVQNAVYNYYYDIFQAVVENAIQQGTLDTGVKTLPGDEFAIKESRVISRDPKTGAATYYYPVTAQVRTNRMSVKNLEDILAHHRSEHARLMVNDKGKLLAAFDTKPIVHADGHMDDASYVFTPARGNFERVENYKLHKYQDVNDVAQEKVKEAQEELDNARANATQYEDLVKRYPQYTHYQSNLERTRARIPELEKALAKAQEDAKDALGAAKQQWQLQYDEAPSHVAAEHHLIGGAVLRWWNPIRESTGERLKIYTAADSKTRQRVVGVEVPSSAIGRLLNRITGGGSTVGAAQIIPDVLRNGLEYTLERGIRVAKGRVGRNPVVQFFPPSQDVAEHLKKLGILYEKGALPIYYLPNGTSPSERSEAEGIMQQVLKAYPVKETGGEAQAEPEEESHEITGSEPPGPGAMNVSEKVNPFQVAETAQALKAMRSAEKTPKQQIKIATNTIGSAKQGLAGAIARAQAAGEALWNWYKNGAAAYSDFDKQVDQWIGAKQLSALEVRQLEREAYKTVPDRLTREAMVNIMETPRDPAEQEKLLKERADKAPLRWKQGYEKAMHLSSTERAVVSNFRVLMDHALAVAQKNGVLENGVEDYIQHVWKRVPKKAQDWYRRVMAELNYSSLRPNPAFTRKRVWQTYYDGELAGAEPEHKDAVYLVGYHLRSLYNAIADRAFIRQLFTQKAEDGRPMASVAGGVVIPKPDDDAILVKPNIKKQSTADYVHIDHPALRRWKWAGEDDQGRTIFMQGDAFVHPEVARKLKNILGRSMIRDWSIGGVRPGAALLGVQREAKNLLLTAIPSWFHETTVRVHAAEHKTNPLHDLRGNLDIDVSDPDVRKLIMSGLMVYNGRGYEQYSEGLASGGAALKIPGYGRLLAWHQERLFGYVIPGLKVQMAKAALKRNLARYRGEMSRDQIYKLTANQANAAFGELNYDSLGRNKTVQDVLRMLLLAPDFLEARARFAGQAMRPGGREQLMALALGAAAMYTVARLLNEALNKDPHWDRPFSVIVGKHEFSVRSIQADLLHLLTDPRQFAVVRLHPVSARTMLEFLSGTDDLGRKRDPWEQLSDFVQRNMPIPGQSFLTRRGLTAAQKVVRSAMATFGVNEKLYRTDAEQEAFRDADLSPSKAASRPQAERMREYRREMNEGGKLDLQRVNEDVREHKLAPQDRKTLVRNSRQPFLAQQLSELPLPELLRIWDKMNEGERQRYRALFARRAYAEVLHYPGPDRAAWRSKVDKALASRPSSVPAFVRRLFGSHLASR